MKNGWIWLASLIFLMLTSLVGCNAKAPLAAEDGRNGLSTQTAISPTQVIMENNDINGTQVQPPLGDEITEYVKWAKQDLARKLGIAVDGITVAAVIGQEFSADAFHCRTTKERIAREDPPVVISGFIILLSTSGRRYEYHASGQTELFCRPLL
jgi:hypothetical protein